MTLIFSKKSLYNLLYFMILSATSLFLEKYLSSMFDLKNYFSEIRICQYYSFILIFGSSFYFWRILDFCFSFLCNGFYLSFPQRKHCIKWRLKTVFSSIKKRCGKSVKKVVTTKILLQNKKSTHFMSIRMIFEEIETSDTLLEEHNKFWPTVEKQGKIQCIFCGYRE